MFEPPGCATITLQFKTETQYNTNDTSELRMSGDWEMKVWKVHIKTKHYDC